jgi:hypothetical protein
VMVSDDDVDHDCAVSLPPNCLSRFKPYKVTPGPFEIWSKLLTSTLVEQGGAASGDLLIRGEEK